MSREIPDDMHVPRALSEVRAVVEHQSNRNAPWWHIAMGLSGWVLYLLVPHAAILTLAVLLSLLAVPRFIRGPKERARTRVYARIRMARRPSRRTEPRLLPGEQFLLEVHEHPIGLLKWWLGGIGWSATATAIAIFWMWQVAAIFWTLGMSVLLVRVVLWRIDKICLTDKRIFAVHGLISLTVTAIPLKKVTDKSFSIPWHSAVLTWLRIVKTEYGKMTLETAGEGTKLTSIVYVPHVVEVNNLIMEHALG